MEVLQDLLFDFESVFNPDKIEGHKLIDSKTGYFLSYRIDFDIDGINVIAQFGYKDIVIQSYGIAENIENQTIFGKFYAKHKDKIVNKNLEEKQIQYKKAIKKLNW